MWGQTVANLPFNFHYLAGNPSNFELYPALPPVCPAGPTTSPFLQRLANRQHRASYFISECSGVPFGPGSRERSRYASPPSASIPDATPSASLCVGHRYAPAWRKLPLLAMTKLLQQAIDKVSALPEATQQSIAEDLIAHVESVEHLRAELQEGIDSLDRGEGEELDIEKVIRTARATYERN